MDDPLQRATLLLQAKSYYKVKSEWFAMPVTCLFITLTCLFQPNSDPGMFRPHMFLMAISEFYQESPMYGGRDEARANGYKTYHKDLNKGICSILRLGLLFVPV